MARLSGSSSRRNQDNRDREDELDLDEIDQFHKNQEEILLDQSGQSRRGGQEDFEMSDEEVLGISGTDDDEQEEEDIGEQEDDDDMDDEALYGRKRNNDNDGEEGWGTSKNNYYGADVPQDEEDAKREEEEALRLQKAHLAELGVEDYFEEDDLDEWKKSAKDIVDGTTSDIVRESLPDQDPTLLNSGEKLSLLKTWYPEVLPFIGELKKYSPELEILRNSRTSSSNGSIKFAALSSYLGSINAYFALFIGTIDKGKVNLKDHDILKGILKARELWRLAQELDQEEEHHHRKGHTSINLSDEDTTIWHSASEDFSSDEEAGQEDVLDSLETHNNNKRKRTEQLQDDSDNDDEFTVKAPTATSTILRKKTKTINSLSDYREEENINEIDLTDKQARKKSLRFYTSKIDQQALKSSNHVEKFSGDLDLPYKERHFERQQRLMEEARQRGLKSSKSGVYDPADDFGSDNDNDSRIAKQVNEGFSNDYYDAVKGASMRRKQDRQISHIRAVEAAKTGRLGELAAEEGAVGEGGSDKRAINYQILKNKGLTPKRNKDNRNARVKKRKKYDAAKKKLSSTRQVYKAPTSAYGGEQTGIKKNISRGVRFAN